MDSYGKKAGKGALIQEELSGTLGVSQDQYLFQPIAYGVTTKGNGDAFISKERHTSLSNGGGQAGQGYPCVCYGIDTYNQAAEEEMMQTIRTNGGGDCIPKVVYPIENHPNDSRVKLADDDIVQSLTSRMGTGGGNVPLVMFSKVRRAQNDHDFETWKESEITNTMNTFDRGDVRCTDAVVCKK